ncbi:MAG: hypothetical protein ABL999_03805 [Pyrinomonadaceae bacterium]
MKTQSSDADIDELRAEFRRLETVTAKINSWDSKKTWDDANRLIGQIPLRVLSLEERENYEFKLFAPAKTISERERIPSFAETVGSSDYAGEMLLEFLGKLCERAHSRKRDELKTKLIADARYYEQDIHGSVFGAELRRQTKAIKRDTEVEMLKLILASREYTFSYSDRLAGGFRDELIRLEEFLRPGIYRQHGIGFDQIRDAVLEITRSLVNNHKIHVDLSDLGIEKNSPIRSSTEKVISHRLDVNREEAHVLTQRLNEEIRRIKERINVLERERYEKTILELPFEIFPAGEWQIGHIATLLQRSGVVLNRLHIQRLEKIEEAFGPPEGYAAGKLDSRAYKGYWVFLYEKAHLSIVENPLYGNATYIIKGTWQDILEVLKLSKSEVRRHPLARFVIHREEDQWIYELESAFHNF